MNKILIVIVLVIFGALFTGCHNESRKRVEWDVDVNVRNNTEKIISFKIDDQTLNVPPGETYKMNVDCVDWIFITTGSPTDPGDYSNHEAIVTKGYKLSYKDGTAETEGSITFRDGIYFMQLYVAYSEEEQHLILIR